MLIKLIPEWKSHFDCLIPIGCYSKSQMGGVRLKNFLRSFEVDVSNPDNPRHIYFRNGGMWIDCRNPEKW